MNAITSELEALRDAIETDEDQDILRQTARDLCAKAEEVEADNRKLEDKNVDLDEELQEALKHANLDYQTLQLKHPRLFTGDLSRLTHADRRELFEEIYNFEGHSTALDSIEHRIS